MLNKVGRTIKIFPFYYGLSADLIFYIAINTIWLVSVKGFSAVQMNLLSTVGAFIGLTCQLPALFIIKKIGNVASIRLGAMFFLLSSILFTFGTDYIFFVFAEVFYELAFLFEMITVVILKNNLSYLKSEDRFVEIRSRGSMVYSILTAFATLTCGFLFNINNYLPMLLGILTCGILFVITFFIVDPAERTKTEKNEKIKIYIPKPVNIFLFMILFYGLAFGIVVFAQSNGKLLIQNILNTGLTVEKTAVLISLVMFISRIIRIIGNYFFPKIYKKTGDKTGTYIILIVFIACAFILLGGCIKADFYVKAVICTIGFSVIPFLRDPAKIFCQKIVLEKFDEIYHKDILAFMSMGRSLIKFVLSLLISFTLIYIPLHYLFVVFLSLLIPVMIMSFVFWNNKQD